ncbi:DMT family transporter [Gymnodinialimonas sp. 2305UL16-5]|uniref:DMT family transporter n=1 Tax=Gymnodinialimonas mytili TaxID=3126503 RepID=UPI0030B22875
MTDGPAPPASRADNLRGAAWLMADMSLNIWALSIVKAYGAEYSATQVVFMRAGVGLVLLLPWLWRDRASFRQIDRLGLHAVRVVLSSITLAASFYAIPRISFALFTAINFTRPILLMLLAALLLREQIGRWRWLAAAIGLIGALIAAAPGSIAWNWGLASLCLAVLTGTLAVILTRRLKGTPTIVMMVFYTAGLGLVTAPFALMDWHAVPAMDLPFLLGVGVFAQLAQFCFLRAHWLGDAGVLGPVSYSSILLSASAGYLFFGEIPTLNLLAGAALIILASLWIVRTG